MALRFAVQADTEQECAAGLRLLESLGLQTAMQPRLLTDDRWMARAVPRMTKARPMMNLVGALLCRADAGGPPTAEPRRYAGAPLRAYCW